MASQPSDQDLQQRLREMEAELNQSAPSPQSPSPQVTVETPQPSIADGEVSLVAIASSVLAWFNGLGSTGKIIAGENFFCRAKFSLDKIICRGKFSSLCHNFVPFPRPNYLF